MNKVTDKYYGTLRQRDWNGQLKRGDWFYVNDNDAISLIALGDGLMAYIDTDKLNSNQSHKEIDALECESKVLDIQTVFEKYPLDYGQDMIGNLIKMNKMNPIDTPTHQSVCDEARLNRGAWGIR